MKLPLEEHDLLVLEVRTHRHWEVNGATQLATCHCGESYPIPEDAPIEWFRAITCPRALRLIDVFELEAGPSDG